jgi:hypothetical protein
VRAESVSERGKWITCAPVHLAPHLVSMGDSSPGASTCGRRVRQLPVSTRLDPTTARVQAAVDDGQPSSSGRRASVRGGGRSDPTGANLVDPPQRLVSSAEKCSCRAYTSLASVHVLEVDSHQPPAHGLVLWELVEPSCCPARRTAQSHPRGARRAEVVVVNVDSDMVHGADAGERNIVDLVRGWRARGAYPSSPRGEGLGPCTRAAR